MTELEHEAGLSTYEIRVQGWLGPLLLSALPHTATAQVPRHTLLIAEASDEQDLVEIVQRIIATGLEVESVRETTHPQRMVRPLRERPAAGPAVRSASSPVREPSEPE